MRNHTLWRPAFEADVFLASGADLLGLDLKILRSRRRDAAFVRARDLLILLGVERYRLKVKYLAREFNRSPDGMTKAVARAITRRSDDDSFRSDLNRVDRTLAKSLE